MAKEKWKIYFLGGHLTPDDMKNDWDYYKKIAQREFDESGLKKFGYELVFKPYCTKKNFYDILGRNNTVGILWYSHGAAEDLGNNQYRLLGYPLAFPDKTDRLNSRDNWLNPFEKIEKISHMLDFVIFKSCGSKKFHDAWQEKLQPKIGNVQVVTHKDALITKTDKTKDTPKMQMERYITGDWNRKIFGPSFKHLLEDVKNIKPLTIPQKDEFKPIQAWIHPNSVKVKKEDIKKTEQEKSEKYSEGEGLDDILKVRISPDEPDEKTNGEANEGNDVNIETIPNSIEEGSVVSLPEYGKSLDEPEDSDQEKEDDKNEKDEDSSLKDEDEPDEDDRGDLNSDDDKEEDREDTDDEKRGEVSTKSYDEPDEKDENAGDEIEEKDATRGTQIGEGDDVQPDDYDNHHPSS